ncbi:hypothetical protein KM043_011196 [Ampulex compressa]|nr:hypothetical protein KM043_011196 [Ampulex compressa]
MQIDGATPSAEEWPGKNTRWLVENVPRSCKPHDNDSSNEYDACTFFLRRDKHSLSSLRIGAISTKSKYPGQATSYLRNAPSFVGSLGNACSKFEPAIAWHENVRVLKIITDN